MAHRELLESLSTEDARLQVRFTRFADRYGHAIEWAHGDVVQVALVSVEGAADERWPASPTLQQLHFEERREGVGGRVVPESPHDTSGKPLFSSTVALMVGLAGSSHWSLSIEPRPPGAVLEFDVACRVAAGQHPQLQSTYRPGEGVSSRCGLTTAAGWFAKLPDGWQISLVTTEPATRLENSDPAVLKIVPGADPSRPTWRWKYRVELRRG